MFRLALRSALLVAVLALPLDGCGAIFGGTTESIDVRSAPTGATVTTEPETDTYTTPTSIELARKSSYTLHFTKDGYSEATFRIQNNLRGGILVLDILTGLVPVIVDAATGAWYNLSPDDAQATLEKRSALVDGPDEIHVSVRKDGDGGVEVTSEVPVEVGVTAGSDR